MGEGFLKIELFVGDHVLPVKDLTVLVKDTKGRVIYELMANENGETEKVPLNAPDKKDSLDPYGMAPRFSVYDVEVPTAKGFKKVIVHGVQIFDTVTSILPVQLHPAVRSNTPEENIDEIFIPIEHGADMQRGRASQPYTDNYSYDGDNNIMQMALANEVAIPQYITVHLGSPNATAENIRVPFDYYIKNVASSEIFPFWEEAALYANIYAQISFVLNRVYTVWYRSQGKDFDITNNTAFDQFFVKDRNIFENISRIVDGIFNMFLRRQGRREPFFASYCNGTTSTCDGLSQFGSQELALRGYSYIQILRAYYPNDIQIVESTNFTSANVGAFPGASLTEGSSGEAVRTMQIYLNRISGNWYIPSVGVPDGVYGSRTTASVAAFQRLFNITADGIIGKTTWYQITRIYVAVKELAELTSEGERIGIGETPPTVTIQMGARGEYVVLLQFLLNFISEFFPVVPFVIQNGVFQDETKRSLVEFQKEFGLTPDGIVGPATWRKLYEVYQSIEDAVVIPPPITPEPPAPGVPPFPGTSLRLGSTGSDVALMQNYLNGVARVYASIPVLVVDGSFGPTTQSAVIQFQQLFGLTADGVIGPITWYKIIDVYNNLTIGQTPQFPGTALRIGSRGNDVLIMQNYLSAISRIFPSVPNLSADGVFGTGTQASVIAFQSLFGLTPDGVIGRYTWDKIVYIYNNLPNVYSPQFPGTSLTVGSRGNDVLVMQKYLNVIAAKYPSIPTLTADGVFGSATQSSVSAFQRQFGLTADGVIGRITWNHIVSIYNRIIMDSATGRIYSAESVKATNTSSFEMDKLAMVLMLGMLRRY